jgi:hypothetical protein
MSFCVRCGFSLAKAAINSDFIIQRAPPSPEGSFAQSRRRLQGLEDGAKRFGP